MNVCEVDVEDSQPLSVFIVKLLGFTCQWNTRGKTLTALLPHIWRAIFEF